MLLEAAEVQPWQSKGEQIANAAKNLGQSYWFCWRIAQGRVGKRAFRILKGSFERYAEKRQRAAIGRLEILERTVAGLANHLKAGADGSADRVGDAPDPARLRGIAKRPD